MKLLIADDDDYTRNGVLESIDWNKYQIYDIEQARDGEEALQIARRFKPDIVLTDIRMPKLNGIQFAEKLVEASSTSKLLFMSGYMDIDYLKSAIRLAAVDYIEKPIRLPELEDAVRKTVDSINVMQKHALLISEKVELQRHELANRLKQKNMNMAIIDRLCKETDFPTQRNYVCLVIRRVDKSDLDTTVASTDACVHYWREKGIPCLITGLEDGELLIILAIKRMIARNYLNINEHLLQACKGFYLGIGNEVSDLSQIPLSFQAAIEASNHFFYHPERRLFFYQDQDTSHSFDDPYPEFFQLLKNEPQKLYSWLNALCDKFDKFEYPFREQISILFSSFVRAMVRENGKWLSRLPRLYHIEELERSLRACPTLRELREWMNMLLQAYVEEVDDLAQYSRLVRDVMEYIASNCSKINLDVSEIADHVHLSTVHLGVLFKQETGITIKQYIGDYRLELAKKLISSEHYKINTIAEQCGYASASYFTKIFRASTNLTPVEYRRKIMK